MSYLLNIGVAGGQARRKKALLDPKNIELNKRINKLRQCRFTYEKVAEILEKEGYRNSKGNPYDAPKIYRIQKMFKSASKTK